MASVERPYWRRHIGKREDSEHEVVQKSLELGRKGAKRSEVKGARRGGGGGGGGVGESPIGKLKIGYRFR